MSFHPVVESDLRLGRAGSSLGEEDARSRAQAHSRYPCDPWIPVGVARKIKFEKHRF